MNILQICHKPPCPPIDGASIAMYNLFRGLTDNGHQVQVLAMNTYKQHCDITKVPDEFIKISKYTLVEIDIRVRALSAFFNLFTNQSYNIVRFNSTKFRHTLSQLLLDNSYDVIILESLYSTCYIDILKQKTKALIVLRAHNAEFVIWENLRNHERNRLKKWYLNLLCARLKAYELRTLAEVNLVACISNEDISAFKKESCATPMAYLPFGINFNDEEFKNYSYPEADEQVLFHIGSMDWIPHQEAFKWFFEKVWQKVCSRRPNIKLYLAGSNMPDWITNGNFRNLIVSNGYVEGKSFMSKKAIMIVPSFSGSGIRIKIAEGGDKNILPGQLCCNGSIYSRYFSIICTNSM